MIDDSQDATRDKQQPSPITRADILSVLQYICPPSSLQPVPARLLSLPLLQRHHFLNISPDDPAGYLAWPSEPLDIILLLLESIEPEDLFNLPTGSATHPDVHYLADPEQVYAHVRITPTVVLPASHSNTQTSLRLIFLWDQASCSWRYHNSAIGSFPENSHPDLSHAMALFHSPDDFIAERAYTSNANNLDDAYWDAYNTIGGDSASSGLSAKPPAVIDTEDAYWAQYSKVQGSADSTIPSPRLLDRKQLQLQQTEVDQRIFIPSSELNSDLFHPEVYNPLAPPSPSSLIHKLASLPVRPDSPPLQDDEPPSASATSSSPQSPHADLTGDPSFALDPAPASSRDDCSRHHSPADEALKHTIKGLYRLWNTGSKSQQDFLDLVQQAISEQ